MDTTANSFQKDIDTGVAQNNSFNTYKLCMGGTVAAMYRNDALIYARDLSYNEGTYSNLKQFGFGLGAGARLTNFTVEDTLPSPYPAPGEPADVLASIKMVSHTYINFGDQYTGSGSFTDPDSRNWTATVDYGDGTGVQPLSLSGQNFSLSHMYTARGSYQVTVTVTDERGGTGTSQTGVDFTPVGTLYFNDFRNQANDWTLSTGNGSAIRFTSDGSGGVSCSIFGGCHFVGSYDLNIDNIKCVSDFTASQQVGNTTPVMLLDPNGGYIGFYLDQGTAPTSGYYLVDYTNGATQHNFFTGKPFEYGPPHNWRLCLDGTIATMYKDGNKIFTKDLAGNGGTYTNLKRFGFDVGFQSITNFLVESIVSPNAKPNIAPIQSPTINEGATYTAAGSFTDPDSASWTATVDYGDGTGVQPLSLAGQSFSLNHVYLDNGVYTVTVSVADNQGASETALATITVANVPPNIGTVAASANPVQINTTTTLTAPFIDPGVTDIHTVSWDWGDGTSSSGTVVEPNGASAGTVTGMHSYATAGVYEVTLTVTDNAGASTSTTFQYISAYNPTPQGLFVGVRKFNSPAGAYTADGSLTGQADFGISAKYQGTAASGRASMSFKAANFDFTATSIGSLVIAGNTATLRGIGTVNGQAGYTFLARGLDGPTDYIRFQIKDATGAIVYDSQPGAADTAAPTVAVTAGQVTVH